MISRCMLRKEVYPQYLRSSPSAQSWAEGLGVFEVSCIISWLCIVSLILFRRFNIFYLQLYVTTLVGVFFNGVDDIE